MKTVIIYASKTGTTEKCANILRSYLDDVEVVNIDQIHSMDIAKYEQIIFGSYIRIGSIGKKIKEFILQNKEILKEKSTSVFLCCGFSENIEQYMKDNIPNDLIEKLVIYDSFGGELDLSKQKGFDKLIVKMVMKSNPNKEINIVKDNIEKFSQQLKK